MKVVPKPGKFNNRWTGPYIITKSYSNVNYNVQSTNNKSVGARVHANGLKPYKNKATIPPHIQRKRMTEPNNHNHNGPEDIPIP